MAVEGDAPDSLWVHFQLCLAKADSLVEKADNSDQLPFLPLERTIQTILSCQSIMGSSLNHN